MGQFANNPPLPGGQELPPVFQPDLFRMDSVKLQTMPKGCRKDTRKAAVNPHRSQRRPPPTLGIPKRRFSDRSQPTLPAAVIPHRHSKAAGSASKNQETEEMSQGTIFI